MILCTNPSPLTNKHETEQKSAAPAPAMSQKVPNSAFSSKHTASKRICSFVEKYKYQSEGLVLWTSHALNHCDLVILLRPKIFEPTWYCFSSLLLVLLQNEKPNRKNRWKQKTESSKIEGKNINKTKKSSLLQTTSFAPQKRLLLHRPPKSSLGLLLRPWAGAPGRRAEKSHGLSWF